MKTQLFALYCLILAVIHSLGILSTSGYASVLSLTSPKGNPSDKSNQLLSQVNTQSGATHLSKSWAGMMRWVSDRVNVSSIITKSSQNLDLKLGRS